MRRGSVFVALVQIVRGGPIFHMDLQIRTMLGWVGGFSFFVFRFSFFEGHFNKCHINIGDLFMGGV